MLRREPKRRSRLATTDAALLLACGPTHPPYIARRYEATGAFVASHPASEDESAILDG
jgi:hypothetical protein